MEELPREAFGDADIAEIFGEERSHSDIIASYIQRFEKLVNNAEEGDATPLLAANGTDLIEDEPEVVDLEEEAPEVREVIENGTNMSVTPDHDEILERDRLHEEQLEEARDEVAAKQQSINKQNDQIVMLEHAIFDREQEMLDQNNRHYLEKT
jgi:hypothetical protein